MTYGAVQRMLTADSLYPSTAKQNKQLLKAYRLKGGGLRPGGMS
jgi:hypothetical protein